MRVRCKLPFPVLGIGLCGCASHSGAGRCSAAVSADFVPRCGLRPCAVLPSSAVLLPLRWQGALVHMEEGGMRGRRGGGMAHAVILPSPPWPGWLLSCRLLVACSSLLSNPTFHRMY